jgi:hypothetical protein
MIEDNTRNGKKQDKQRENNANPLMVFSKKINHAMF